MGCDIYDVCCVVEEMGFFYYVLDYENIFKDVVIDEFVDSYLVGVILVFCICCNEWVKFKDLLEIVCDLDVDCMVIGYYI